MTDLLPFGPLPASTLFVCIDMQRLFLEPGDWYCPEGLGILPNCAALAEAGQGRTVFTRFVTAHSASEAEGSWHRYYTHWDSVTLSQVGLQAMEIAEGLHPFATPDRTFDKATHSAFESPEFVHHIEARAPDAMVIFGIETDVCVLATVMTAVDRGIRVLLPEDALASSDMASHEACLSRVYPRMDQQIEITDTQTVLKAWAGR